MMFCRTLVWVLSVVLCGALFGCASWVQPNLKQDIKVFKSGEFELDRDHSSLVFKIGHMGLSKFVGRFNRFEADLSFDAARPEEAKLGAVIDMASLDLVDDKFETVIKGGKWLNVKRYPKSYFQTTSAKKLNSQTMLFTGVLTFLGESNPVAVEVRFNGAGVNILTQKYTIGFSANASFKRSQFGLTRYIPTVSDTVELEVHAEFQRE